MNDFTTWYEIRIVYPNGENDLWDSAESYGKALDIIEQIKEKKMLERYGDGTKIQLRKIQIL